MRFLLAAAIVILISAFIAFNRSRSYSSQATSDVEDSADAHLWRFEVVPIEGAVGPESFAFDPHGGGPYTGVSDGRIIKWQQSERRWIDFAVTSPERYVRRRTDLYLILNVFFHPTCINPSFFFSLSCPEYNILRLVISFLLDQTEKGRRKSEGLRSNKPNTIIFASR